MRGSRDETFACRRCGERFALRYFYRFVLYCAIFLALAGCAGAVSDSPAGVPSPTPPTNPTQQPAIEGDTAVPPPTTEPIAPSAPPAQLIQPGDLAYLGAFRLPDRDDWEYSGYAMTYYPDGDPNGSGDGFPGSLFILGHDQQQLVAEISIPAPIVSPDKNAAGLNRAALLQPFADITGGAFGELEIPRAGLAYLPPQAGQASGKLYFAWGQHFEFERTPTHGWSELDLSAPQTAGLWYVGDFPNYVLNDYLFPIPEAWAGANAPGQLLATGRFRDGVWSGLGPSLFAIGPWLDGNPPPPGARLGDVTPLLLYGRSLPNNPEIDVSEGHQMNNYAEPDEWSGGAWLTAGGGKTAVIFVGTKALGESWYGFANGVVYPTSGDADEEYPEVPPWPYDDRGWWSEDIEAQIIFYNPDELAAVARGEMATWDPQPYAVMSLDDLLFDTGFDYERQKRYLVGAVSFDRERGYLYIVERRADEERSLIHVFQIN